MLTSFPRDYPRLDNKKRSFGCDGEPHWTKRTKQCHSPTSRFSPRTSSTAPYHSTVPQQLQQHRSLPLASTPVIPITNDTVAKETMDVMMVDSLDSSCYSERIDDIEKYLDEGSDANIKEESVRNQPIDIYALLERQHRPLTVMLVNGMLLPMERQQDGKKHCIPEFVLRSPKPTTCNKSSLPTYLNDMSMDQSLQTQQFMLCKDDSIMDID